MPQKIRLPIIIAAVFVLVGCASVPTALERKDYGPGTIVAVWNLEDLSPIKAGQPELEEFISATVIETLENRCGFRIVEREKLILALEELSLGSSELASESSRLQIGRILGAELMVFGAYQVIGSKARLDLRLVVVERGLIISAASKETAAQDLNSRLVMAEAASAELCPLP